MTNATNSREASEKLLYELAFNLIVYRQLRHNWRSNTRRGLWRQESAHFMSAVQSLTMDQLAGISEIIPEGSLAPWLKAQQGTVNDVDGSPQSILVHYATMALAEAVFRQLTNMSIQPTLVGMPALHPQAQAAPAPEEIEVPISIPIPPVTERRPVADAGPVINMAKRPWTGPLTETIQALTFIDVTWQQKTVLVIKAVALISIGLIIAIAAGGMLYLCLR